MQEGRIPEYILLMREDFHFHQSNYYILQLVFSFAECSLEETKEKAPHGGLKFNLSMVGDNSVCHHADPGKIQDYFPEFLCPPWLEAGWAGKDLTPRFHHHGLSSWQGIHDILLHLSSGEDQ